MPHKSRIDEPTPDLIHNDEPTELDGLHRTECVKALAQIARTCATPLVVGLFGTWGTGKTSLMRQIEKELKKTGDQSVATVQFDAWRHQFDDNPVLGLLHAMYRDLNLKSNEEVKNILLAIGTALSTVILRECTGLKPEDIALPMKVHEEQRFQVREARARLREEFSRLLEKALGKSERLVVFIDDLDRCAPDRMIALLEALKLYLDLPKCVYFLAVDRQPVERAIAERYPAFSSSQASYLDKMVQLPFDIPPVERRNIQAFIQPLLHKDFHDCISLLEAGLAENPRRIKRFANALNVKRILAEAGTIKHFNGRLLAVVALIEFLDRSLFLRLATEPELLARVTTPDSSEWEEYGNGESALAPVLKEMRELIKKLRETGEDPALQLASYIFLSNTCTSEVRANIQLNPYESEHLRNMARADGTFYGRWCKSFEKELRHLLELGLIDRVPGKGIRSLRADSEHQDTVVTNHFTLTASGREYLSSSQTQVSPISHTGCVV